MMKRKEWLNKCNDEDCYLTLCQGRRVLLQPVMMRRKKRTIPIMMKKKKRTISPHDE
jgi:hypothetical protein